MSILHLRFNNFADILKIVEDKDNCSKLVHIVMLSCTDNLVLPWHAKVTEIQAVKTVNLRSKLEQIRIQYKPSLVKVNSQKG